MTAAFPLLCALLHYTRGRGILPGGRWTMALLIGLASPFGWLESLLVAAGVYLWLVPGLGKYFGLIHGRYSHDEREILWIDRLGEWLVPHNIRLRCLVQMSLRGLYLVPLFVALALAGYPGAWWIMPLSLLQGPVYWLFRRQGENAVGYAELGMGLLVGAMLEAVA